MIDYCGAVERKKTEIERQEFTINGSMYRAKIAKPGTNYIVCFKEQKSNGEFIEPMIFLIHSEKIYMCAEKHPILQELRNQLEKILQE